MIVINRQKAEGSVRDRLRVEREPLLQVLDVKFMRALESGLDTTAICDEKQALRDVTNKDLSSLTIEQLSILTIADALAI